MAYIGNQVSSSPFITDTYTGNGAQTAFLNMTFAPAAASSIAVYVNGLYQRPVTAYTVSGTTLNFVSAPANGATIVVLHLGVGQTTTTTVADGSISNVKIQATGTANSSTFLRGDGQWAVLNLNSISGDLTVSGNVTVSSNGYLQLPSGNNTTKPVTGAANGAIRYSTSNNRVEVFLTDTWYSITGLTPTIGAVTGNIYRTAATTLNVAVSGASVTDTLEIYEGSNLVSSVSATSTGLTNGSGFMTFVMPSAVNTKTSGTNLVLYLKNTSGLSLSSQTKTVEVARSCKQLLDFGLITTSGVYSISNYGTISATDHYCLQDSSYDGGGWTLLLTMSDGNGHFGGSVNPFLQTSGTPSLTALYALNRASTFTPTDNDQFLLKRSDTNAWVRFVIGSGGWIAGSGWNATTDTHNDFANGQLYSSAGATLTNFTNFNCCNQGGNCASGGGDGCGFGTYNSWLDNSTVGTAYGFAFNGATNGGANPAWGVQASFLTQGAQWFQYFFRKNGTQ